MSIVEKIKNYVSSHQKETAIIAVVVIVIVVFILHKTTQKPKGEAPA